MTLNYLVYSPSIENEETVYHRILYACPTIHNRLANSESVITVNYKMCPHLHWRTFWAFVAKCLLPFTNVFLPFFHIYLFYKDYNTQNYNLTCCVSWILHWILHLVFLTNEGHRLRMLENRVPRSTFGSKTKEEVGKLTKLALHGASSFPRSIKHFSVTRSRRANLQCIILVIKLVEKRTLGRSGHRCENIRNMNVKNRMG